MSRLISGYAHVFILLSVVNIPYKASVMDMKCGQ